MADCNGLLFLAAILQGWCKSAELAKKQRKSVAGLAKELILEALERHEDRALSAIGDERLEKAEQTSEKTVGHEEAWK